MKTKMIYLIVAILIGGAYMLGRFLGWKNEVEQNAISAAIARGATGILMARAIRSGNTEGALKLIEMHLRYDQATLYAFRKKVPSQLRVTFDHVSKFISAYGDEYKTLNPQSDLARIPT